MFYKFFLAWTIFSLAETKQDLSVDAFFNYTTYRALSWSPDGQYLLIQARRPDWNQSFFRNSLWLHEVQGNTTTLITDNLFESTKLQWSHSGTSFIFLKNNLSSIHHRTKPTKKIVKESTIDQYLYIYSVKSRQTQAVSLDNDVVLAIAWSKNDSSVFYASIKPDSTADSMSDNITCTIRQVSFNSEQLNVQPKKTIDIVDVPFLINDLIYAPLQEKLFFTTASAIVENPKTFQIFLYDLENPSGFLSLTTDLSLKQNLQLSSDYQRIFYQTTPLPTSASKQILTQQRLFAVNLLSNQIERWASDFQGEIMSYTVAPGGSIYFVGQMGIDMQIYSQQTSTSPSDFHQGIAGSYLLVASSWSNNSISFAYSSFTNAVEVYFTQDLDEIVSAIQLTYENSHLAEYDLPQGQSYRWLNKDDNRTIEGVLIYPPGKFQHKNLPLLVLIHGGPMDASVNYILGNWYTWGPLAAASGWLVFQPNYRGSSGYGDDFINELRYKPLSLPGNDILYGVDQLIADSLADPTKLTIGGYSYGGFLTNWLITQTSRFNAALSGAGSVEQVSMWGLTDMPVLIDYLFGGYPWENPGLYQSESPIFYMNRILTPTHIVTGQDDIRVPFSQNLMFARAIRYVGIPVKLLLIPDEGHPMNENPWHGKTKVQSELDWLNSFGFNATRLSK